MTWVVMDRNDYIWYDLNKRVNGRHSSRAKFSILLLLLVNNRGLASI